MYSQKIEETMDAVMDQVPEEEKECLILEGDFNVRTANKGGHVGEDEKEEKNENSMDKIINREGRILINKLDERGWSILNGTFGEKGGWTYIGEVGASVIDYAIANDLVREEIEKGRKDRIRSHTIRSGIAWTERNRKEKREEGNGNREKRLDRGRD